MLKTFSLRGRELPLTIYGPRGLARAPRRRCAASSAGSRTRSRPSSSSRATSLDARRVSARDFAVDHGVSAVGYALVEDERPGRFDVEAADGARRARRARARRPPARRARDARRRDAASPRTQVLGPPAAGRKLVLTGDTAPAASVVDAAAGADVLVHEATFLADERERARETLHSTAGEAALVAQEAGVKPAGADAPLDAVLRPRGRRGGAAALPGHGRPARLRRRRDPVSRARRARARPLGRRARPVAAGSCSVRRDVTRLVQVAVAGDVTEAEQLQELLSAAGIESQLEPAVEHDPETLGRPAAQGARRRRPRSTTLATRSRR